MAATLVAPAEISSEEIQLALNGFISGERILVRPIDLIAWASDASFYRLIPKAVVQAQSLDEIRALFAFSQQTRIPMTFRAAGTSLSGQSISNGLLVEVARNWRDVKVEESGKKIRVQPGVMAVTGPEAVQPGAHPVSRQDRAGPGFDRHLHLGRNPVEQFERNVLRGRAERLSHTALHEVHAALRNGNRYLASRCR